MKKVLGCAVLILVLGGVIAGARIGRIPSEDGLVNAGETPSIASPTPATPSGELSNEARGTAHPGTNQPILIGTAVSFAPNLETPAYAFTVAPGTPYEGRVRIESRPRPAKEGAPPVAGNAALVQVLAILDARRVLPLEGRETQGVVLRTDQPTSTELSVTLPPLEAGRHCLVVAVLEDPVVSVGRPAIDHASVAIVDISTTLSGADHCRGQVDARGAAGVIDLPFGCSPPTLSSERDRALSSPRLSARQEAWVIVASCPDSETVTTLFIHNGRPILSGRLSPFSTPSDGRVRSVKVTQLPPGRLRVILIAPNRSGTYSEGFAGRAMLIA